MDGQGTGEMSEAKHTRGPGEILAAQMSDRAAAVRAANRWRRAFFIATGIAAIMALAAWSGWILVWELSR